MGAVRVPVVQQRLRLRHRRQGRPDGRGARSRRDVVNHGRLGPKGLYGSTPWASSPDRLTRPLVREGGRLVETDWDTAMGRIVEASKRLLAEERPADARLLHQRPAVPRGVLHPRDDRQSRPRHTAHGRQHPAVHGDQRRGDEGVVRRRRPARQLHRHRALRRDLPLRPQHGRDPDGALVPHPGPHPRRRPARRSSASTLGVRRSPRRPSVPAACISLRGSVPTSP